MKYMASTVFIGALFLSACATSRWVSTPILDQNQAKVSIEYHMEKDIIEEQQYNHPAEMKPGEIDRLLADLNFVEKIGIVEDIFKEQKPEPVFQPEEIARLAPAISDALAKANSSQRVRFQSINRGGGLIFASRRVTEGILYADASNNLNIAFNLINYELAADEPDEVPSEYKNREPTKVKKFESWAKLVPMSSYAHLQPLESGETSPVWIVADLSKFRDELKSSAPPAVDAAAPKVEPVTPEQSKPLEIKETVAPATEPLVDTNENIKNNLRLLKELHEDGLINDEEYETKKAKIIEKIK